jgi:nucleotide-binding universal stress UspA family protein
VASETVDISTGGAARIVAEVDGSRSSEGALRRGARTTPALDLPLEAVTTWHGPDLHGGYLGEALVPDIADLSAGARAMLDETAQAVFGNDRPTWSPGSVDEGRPAQTLIDDSRGAAMLIVGSRGHGGFAGLLLGSVGEACAEHATRAVLVLHEDESPVPAG